MTAKWKATPDGYAIQESGTRAKLLLAGASPGLRDVVLAPDERGIGPLLAVEHVLVAAHRPFPVEATDQSVHRVRSNLVDLQLRATRRCPAQIHLYWKARAGRQFDLEVLVNTTEAFRSIEVATLSRLPTGKLLVASSARDWLDTSALRGLRANSLVVPRDEAAALASLDGRVPRFGQFVLSTPSPIPLVLFRPDAAAWSYVEMSHPEDCTRVVARVRTRIAEATFGLFGLDIEKGVILRGRVRGAFVERDHDEQHARSLYDQFIAEPPSLSA